MPSPELINGSYYLRLHVPKDVAGEAKGTSLAVPVGDGFRTVKVGSVVKVSLQTRSAAEAKLRFTQALASVEAHWDALRRGPQRLSHKQCVSLAGEVYRDFIRVADEDPISPEFWARVRVMDAHATISRHEGLQGLMINPPPPNADLGIEQRFGIVADAILRRHQLNVDRDSRWRLILQLVASLDKATEVNLFKAMGDYNESGETTRYPEFVPPAAIKDGCADSSNSEPTNGGLTISQLFKLWELDHLASGKSPRTVKDFWQKTSSLIEYLGHDEAERVSPENISDWCDDLKLTKGINPRTVSQKYLAVAKLIFALGVEKRKLTENPAKDSKVRFSKPRKTRSSGFTDDEALIVLKATMADSVGSGRSTVENQRAIRWLPWICAFTGARVTEIAQIRKVDLFEEGGVVCLRITPDAGSVKTGSYRVVPVHPQLLDMGLPAMIRSLPTGPVFYHLRPHRGVAADPIERAQNAGAKVGAWVKEVLKLESGTLQPNHAWRHRFKTVVREVGMDREIRDAIQGHEDGRAASDYGEVTIKAMSRAIAAMPRYQV